MIAHVAAGQRGRDPARRPPLLDRSPLRGPSVTGPYRPSSYTELGPGEITLEPVVYPTGQNREPLSCSAAWTIGSWADVPER